MKWFLWATIILALSSTQLRAEEISNNTEPPDQRYAHQEKLRLSISTDNDLFAPANSDKDYTAGFSIALQSAGRGSFANMLETPIAQIDKSVTDMGEVISTGIEIGSYGFTPNDIEAAELDRSDRPYASLIYVSTNRHYRSRKNTGFWTSAFTLGLLGANVFENGQRIVHKLVSGDKARGWDSQISDGGELTARYQLAYHQPLNKTVANQQLKTSYFGSIGYLTEAGIALSYRKGLISSPDYRFNPAITSYGEQTNASDTGSTGEESYFWGGVGLKFRAYNAFLEGQFRDSEHTFKNSQLRPIIAEIWAGYTLSIVRDTKLSYVFRAHSSEIREGEGDRNLMWGGFVFSTAFSL